MEIDISNAKAQMLENIIFSISINGAFQRNKVYKDIVKPSEQVTFKNQLYNKLSITYQDIFSIPDYSDNLHYATIFSFSNEISAEFNSILHQGRFKIGTTQKLLNLYWKCKWVINKTNHPPLHCPFDGIIINKLTAPIKYWKWTQIDDIEKYKVLVDTARSIIGTESLAEWELRTYNKPI